MNVGSIIITLALIVSFGSIIFYYKSINGNIFDIKLSRAFYYGSFFFLSLAYILLTIAFLNNDFRYSYVYGYSSRELEWYYLLSAVWAGQSGSFLLWVLLLNIFGLYVIRKNEKDEGILMLVVLVTQFFILLVLMQDSPFAYIWENNPNARPGVIPADGSGLNPLLIDPWMVIHPPLLFMGYASASIPFAYTVRALIRKEYDVWVDRSYKWVLFSFVTLGIGIFLGGYWAYTVLGWGGYWGWDPVENSSLIPWLVGLILFHGLLLQRRKKILVRTNIISSLLYIILVFFSTYLTRSGVLANFSVHSFGDSIIGIYLLTFLVILNLFSWALFFFRAREIKSKPMDQNIFGWDTLLVYGLISLGVFTLLILIGTSMPIITGILMAKASSVTEGYYNSLSIPFVLLILSLMVLSTMSLLSKSVVKTTDIIIFICSITAAVFFNMFHTTRFIAYVFTAVGCFVIARYIFDLIKLKKPAVLASRIAHIGLGVLVVGAVSSNIHSVSDQKKIFKGRSERVGSVDIRFNGFTNEKKSSMVFTVKDGVKVMDVKTKFYMQEKSNSLYREPYIIYGFFNDIYIIPEKFEEGSHDHEETGVIGKNETKVISGVTVIFLGFDQRKINDAEPQVYANLLVNGHRLSPGKKINRTEGNTIDVKIPGTERIVSLAGINPSQEKILLHVSSDSKSPGIPDSVIVNVSNKRFIWLVWLGTVLITAGSTVGFIRYRQAEAAAK